MRAHVGWRKAFLAACAAGALQALPSAAGACSVPPPRPPTGLPRSGQTGVSTATSLIILSQGRPAGLTLQVAGLDIPLDEPLDLGPGYQESFGASEFWQVRAATAGGSLVASAEHVVTAQFQSSTPGETTSTVEVTRFSTGAGYDKVQGVPPLARSVRLWRVRYPLSEIGSGDCVFDEYHGFLTVDYDPATIPNTPPSSVVHTFSLRPKTGDTVQTFLYAGDHPFQGLAPGGDHPLPIGAWQPDLDPTREYCLTIAAFGDGDIARPPLSSQPVCASVTQLSSAGAPPSPDIGGGCAVGGARTGGAAGALAATGALTLAARHRRRRQA